MNTKIITALVAFFAAFIVSVGLVLLIMPLTPIDQNQVVALKLSNNYQYARGISNLLREDDLNGKERIEGYDDSENADNVAEYVNKSSQINDESLPADFQLAWHKHLTAWHNYADFLKDMENPKLRKNFNEDQILNISNEHTMKINSSFEEVVRISRKYGATIPDQTY